MEKLKLFLEELGKLFPEKSKFLREQLGIIEDEIIELKKRNKKLEESIAFSKSDKTKVSYFDAFWNWAQKRRICEKVLQWEAPYFDISEPENRTKKGHISK